MMEQFNAPPVTRKALPSHAMPPHKPPPNNALGAAMAALRTDEEFNDFIKSSAVGTAVVEFGSSWCAKCHEIFPAFYTLARQYPGHSFALAQVDHMKEAAAGLRYSPTFAFYRKGKKVDVLVGKDAQKLADRVWLHAD